MQAQGQHMWLVLQLEGHQPRQLMLIPGAVLQCQEEPLPQPHMLAWLAGVQSLCSLTSCPQV